MKLPAPLAIGLGALFGVLVTLQPVADSDVFWHVASGQRTIGLALPRVDLFSWTINGSPVLTDQWLGDAILAAARQLGDWRGILALRAAAVALLVALVVDTALVARPRAPLVAVLAALPALALARFSWTDRPELLGLVCFAVLVRLLRDGDRGLLLSIALLFVWAQLHGSYALGLALVLAACAVRSLSERRERWRYVPIATAALVATLVTPAGVATWTSSGGHFLAPPRYVSEEGVPDAATLPGALFLIALALLFATALLRKRISMEDAAPLVLVAFVAMTAARYTPLLAIAAAPYFASTWPDPLARWRRVPEEHGRPTEGPRAGRVPVAPKRRETPRREGFGRSAVLAVSIAALAIAVGLADAKVGESGYPRAALAALPSGAGTLNQYDWGGYLIEFAPRTPVFIDGRLFPYVPSVLEDYRAIIGAHPGWEDVVARRGVIAMLVRPTDAIAVRAPDRGWRVAYRDDIAVVLVR